MVGDLWEKMCQLGHAQPQLEAHRNTLVLPNTMASGLGLEVILHEGVGQNMEELYSLLPKVEITCTDFNVWRYCG